MKLKIVLLSLLVIQLQISLAFVRLRGSKVFVKNSLLGPKLAIVGQVPQINDIDVTEDMRRNSLSTSEILEALEALIGSEQPLPVTNTREQGCNNFEILMNREREMRGLPRLECSEKLREIALTHAMDQM